MSRRAALALLLFGLTTPALADYKSAFDAGRTASERQEWARVQSNMRQALAEQPNPSADTRISGFPYLPKFYLGLASFNLNDCPAALELLEDAATVAAMRGLREADRQALMVRTCKARLAAAARASAPTVATSAAKPPPASTAPVVKPPPTTSVAAVRPSTVPVAASGNDAKQLAALRDRLGVIDVNSDRAARLLADPSMAANAEAWRTRIQTQTAQTRRIRTLLAGADRNREGNALANLEREVVALNQTSTALNTELGKAHDAARQAAVAARSAAAAEQRQLRVQMGSAMRPMLDAFFTGKYAQVAGWKPDASFDRVPEAKAQALLLRAAARHAQFVLSGERDVALADQARADVLEARRLAAQMQLSTRAFSPRFRDFASAR